ncbi:MAG: alpha/beta hydrolase-fold protein [Actinomycetota bacterium]
MDDEPIAEERVEREPTAVASVDDVVTRSVPMSWIRADGETAGGLRYRMAVPDIEVGDSGLPLILHLHGATQSWAGVRGEVDGLVAMIDETNGMGPAIVVAPFDATGWSMWADKHDGTDAVATLILDELLPEMVERGASADPGRTVISGFSMGGFGAATFASRAPERFGAVLVWDGAMHDWTSLQTNRPAIAAERFDHDEGYFDDWSPYRSPVTPLPLAMVVGPMQAFAERYAEHLRAAGVDPLMVDTTCGHLMRCLGPAAGEELVAFLNPVVR